MGEMRNVKKKRKKARLEAWSISWGKYTITPMNKSY
jgi:hypothetical protein